MVGMLSHLWKKWSTDNCVSLTPCQLMGLAVYNSINLDVRFPTVCYRKLLSPAVVPFNNPRATVGITPATLEDLRKMMPVSVVVTDSNNRLVGLVVKTFTSRVQDPGFDSCWCCGDFSRLRCTSDMKIGTPVATLPGAWHYRVSAETSQPGVSLLWPGEVESLIGNFYLSVEACELVCADLSLKYMCMLLGH